MAKKLLSADRISDFQPGIDTVIRKGKQCFIHHIKGEYADEEVKSDLITPEIIANLQKLSPEQKIKMIEAVRKTPYLSSEGRRERLQALGYTPFEIVP
jgi:hypothetical protein